MTEYPERRDCPISVDGYSEEDVKAYALRCEQQWMAVLAENIELRRQLAQKEREAA